MVPRLSALALLALFTAACVAAPAPTPTPAATLPAGFDSLASLAREFVPTDGVEQRVIEAADSYEISLTSNSSFQELEALWDQVVETIGLGIGAKVRSPELFRVDLEGLGALSAAPREDGLLDVRIALLLR